MNKTLDDLKVGDTVWWSDVNRRGISDGVVDKVGRKLITVGRLTFRKDTGRTNDEYGHQTLIPDLAAYREMCARNSCIARIRSTLSFSSGASLADVRAAAALLRVSLDGISNV
jgi:hypothetical protein